MFWSDHFYLLNLQLFQPKYPTSNTATQLSHIGTAQVETFASQPFNIRSPCATNTKVKSAAFNRINSLAFIEI